MVSLLPTPILLLQCPKTDTSLLAFGWNQAQLQLLILWLRPWQVPLEEVGGWHGLPGWLHQNWIQPQAPELYSVDIISILTTLLWILPMLNMAGIKICFLLIIGPIQNESLDFHFQLSLPSCLKPDKIRERYWVSGSERQWFLRDDKPRNWAWEGVMRFWGVCLVRERRQLIWGEQRWMRTFQDIKYNDWWT